MKESASCAPKYPLWYCEHRHMSNAFKRPLNTPSSPALPLLARQPRLNRQKRLLKRQAHHQRAASVSSTWGQPLPMCKRLTNAVSITSMGRGRPHHQCDSRNWYSRVRLTEAFIHTIRTMSESQIISTGHRFIEKEANVLQFHHVPAF
jgi:hypothetical protein